MSIDTLVKRLTTCARDPKQATDARRNFDNLLGVTTEIIHAAAPPATPAQVTAAEARLGFGFPSLLRQLYLEVGNGGFGPARGVRGVPTSSADLHKSVVGGYEGERERHQRLFGKTWPFGLILLCDWGCGIESWLDCTVPNGIIVRLDPNSDKLEVDSYVVRNLSPTMQPCARADEINNACWVESPSLERWLNDWLDDKDSFYAAYGEDFQGFDV